MSAPKGDFSQGRVSGLIIRLGLPIMLAELVHVLYNIVDRVYIGHMENGGTEALTGLGVCFPLITLIGAFANLCSTGGSTLSTIARGQGDNERAERIMTTAFTFLLMVGGVLSVVMFAAAPALLRLLGGNEKSLPYALPYFRIYVLGTIPVLISMGMNPFINAQGFPRVGMVTVILGAALNIVLDPLFIFLLDLGVRGAALATILSQTVSALWVLHFLTGKKPVLRLRRLGIHPGELKNVMKLGLTGFTFKVTNSVTQAAVNVMLRAWGGPLDQLYIGAMSLINSLREIMSLPLGGVTTSGQSVMSFNYGARQYRRVSESIRFILLGGLIINGFMWLLVMFIPRPLIQIFTDDEALIALAVRCARIFFGAFPFMALQVTGQNTFVALNYPKHALFFSLLRKIVLVAPLTLLLPGLGLGVDGVFWAEFISQLVGSTACFTTMYFVIWRKMRNEAIGSRQ